MSREGEGRHHGGAKQQEASGRGSGSGHVVALIPARNEAASLPGVLSALSRSGAVDAVLVVDNGSTDATTGVAREAGAAVVSEPRPGYGRACQRGLRELAARRPRPAAVLIVDADDAEGARAAKAIVAPLRRNEADLVTGRRRPRTVVRWHARLGNGLVSRVLRGVYGWRGRDMGPLRGARLDPLLGLRLDDPDFGWNVQMQVRALRAGLRIQEVPVPRGVRTRGKSKISGSVTASLRAGATMLTTLGKEMLAPRRPAPDPGPSRGSELRPGPSSGAGGASWG